MSATRRPYSGGSWLDAPSDSIAPLTVSANGRYLEMNGSPHLVWGVAAWCITNENTIAEQTTRLETEIAHGCNNILIQLVSRYPTLAPNDADNVAPFSTPGDFSTFNSTYFTKARAVVDLAASYGVQCWIAPLWYGFDSDQGWLETAITNGTTACFNYGVAVGNVFASAPNIVWIGGGDRAPDTAQQYAQNVINGILSVDTSHLITWHWTFSASDAEPVSPIDVNACYEWGDIAAQVATEYGEDDGPCVVMESLYDLNDENGYTSLVGRAAVMESMLEGAKGFFWGSEATWHCGAADGNLPSQSQGHNYAAELTSVDRLEFEHMRSAFYGKEWHLLAPDTTADFLTAGNGTAAITPAGDYAVIYSPSAGQTIDRTEMSGSFRAYLIDPTNGVQEEISGSPFPNTTTQTITPTTLSGTNSRGANDWIILLEAE